MNRRHFFSGAATAVAAVSASSVSRVALAALPEPAMQSSADTAPPLHPPTGRPYDPVVTLNGWTAPWRMNGNVKEFHLVAEPVVREVAPGFLVNMWGYNGQSPGPTIEVVEGDRVRIFVTNRLPEHTTIHWHGQRLPNGMDGVGGLNQSAIQPGKTFVYEFTAQFSGIAPRIGLGGSRTKPGSSMVQRTFQGRIRVESQNITARADAGDRLRFEDAAEVKVDVVRFLLLTLDLPPAPLFQDEMERNIIPQVPLASVLSKYDGATAQEHHAQRKRHRLLHPLPPYLAFHVKRFSQNKFVSERNPTIVTFDARRLDMSPYVEPNPAEWPPAEPIWYDLVANVVHEAVRSRDDVADSGEEKKTWKVQVRNKATGEWVVCQDLFVDKVQEQLLYLGETYLQIWERRKESRPKGNNKA